jgi:hypothetical protein
VRRNAAWRGRMNVATGALRENCGTKETHRNWIAILKMNGNHFYCDYFPS